MSMDTEERKILSIIPARGGSKGITGKNIRAFAGKPLIGYSIESAKNAPSVNRIIVSTDDAEIARVSKEYGAEVPFLRPAELATSISKVVDAVVHLVEKLKVDEGYEPTHILLLQPTSPLRTEEDIEKAIALFFSSKADSLVSICRTENVLMTKDADNVIAIQNPELLHSPNRQELPAYYKFDGSMIYLIDTNVLMKERSFLAGKLVGYEIPRWRAADLDEPQDFVVGELIYNNREDISSRIRSFS